MNEIGWDVTDENFNINVYENYGHYSMAGCWTANILFIRADLLIQSFCFFNEQKLTSICFFLDKTFG